MSHSPGFLKLVNEARGRIKETSPEDIMDRMRKGEHLLLVDTREEHEWEEGHLPGAIHLSKGVIERDVEERIPDKSVEIILYCRGGFRSVLAGDNLQKMGYTNVISMDGGSRRWKELGYPIER